MNHEIEAAKDHSHHSSSLIGQLQADDPDDGLNAKIFYYLVSGNSHENFYLDKLHGKLYTNAVLDREQRASYTLVIKATNDPNFIIDPEQEVVYDPEDPTQAIVTIIVEDENDTPPRFLEKLYYAGEYVRYSDIAWIVCDWQCPLSTRSIISK